MYWGEGLAGGAFEYLQSCLFDFLSERVSGVSAARMVRRKEALGSRPDCEGRGWRHGHVPGQGLSL